mgnify:CR=1 FL=1
MEKDMLSIISNRKQIFGRENSRDNFRGCAVMSIIAVVSITGYMIILVHSYFKVEY